MSILQYKKNIYSQNGEDGIIQYIFETIFENRNGTFIEFGAWDGKHLSNTYNLFLNHNWNGIYIEGDTTKYNVLCDNFRAHLDRVDCINAYVGFGTTDNLDALIETHSQKREFDFISIDVDGLDYFIFEKMVRYLPKVICIEVNAGHDPEYPDIIPQEIAKKNIGQSIKVIADLAEAKGYFPLCYNGNLFLVKTEFQSLFAVHCKSIQEIYSDFLCHLEPAGIQHLKQVFIDTNIYNGFLFKNDALRQFVNDHALN